MEGRRERSGREKETGQREEESLSTIIHTCETLYRTVYSILFERDPVKLIGLATPPPPLHRTLEALMANGNGLQLSLWPWQAQREIELYERLAAGEQLGQVNAAQEEAAAAVDMLVGADVVLTTFDVLKQEVRPATACLPAEAMALAVHSTDTSTACVRSLPATIDGARRCI